LDSRHDSDAPAKRAAAGDDKIEAGDMSDPEQDELDAEAEELIEALTVPKRRVRPRLAEPLRAASEHDVATPFGSVQAWRLGKGTAVLLIHGWDDDNCLWRPLIEKFGEVGRPVVALDLPGHGFSRAEDPSAGSAVAAVRAVVAALGPVDAVVGHSFGCAVAMQAMAGGLDIARAAFVAAPVPKPGNRWNRAHRAGVPEEVIARAAELYARRPEALAPPFDLRAAVPRMTAAALFLHAIDDEQCPVEDAEALRDLWPGAKLALADGLGHRLIAQDNAMLDRIVGFIEGGR
jgi:pimeloyl-ACP methyl ester carboxylesterase